MLGKLIPCGGGVPIALLRKTLVLGRRSECDITIPCATVSSRHCMLEFHDGFWWVRDLDSKNGIAVNGQRGAQLKIPPKGILSVGRQRLVVDYQPAPEPAAKTKIYDPDEDLALDFLNATMDDDPKSPDQTSSTADRRGAEMASNSPAAKGDESPAKSRPSRDLGKLIPCGGGVPIPLRSEELILGRGPECDVRIRFPSVSSRHCKLRFDQGYWLVEDLHSTNGTWVDGDRCMLQCLLPESVLALDKHRFTIHYSPQGDGPPPVVRQLFSQSLLEKAGLASEFSGDRLGRMQLPDDDADRPKRYNLLDSDHESD